MHPIIPEPIPGIAFDFGGGRTYTVPPLNLAALQRLQVDLQALSAAPDALAPTTVQTVITATHAALRRNYPSITPDEVAELIDVANMHDVIACVLDVAGLKRKDAAKNPPAQPLPQTPAPTGLPS